MFKRKNTPSESPVEQIGASTDHSIQLKEVSRWFGDIVALSDVSFNIGSGVTGLLGPNGAGKSTALKIMSGLLPPSSGEALIMGRPPRSDVSAYRELGLVAEHEIIYPFLSGREYVRLNAKLQGLKDVNGATERAIELVDMADAAERKVGGYSKGMRQRIKIAGALVHDPDVILMDEPLNGTDPVQRAEIIKLIRQLGRDGKTVVVSSHVLVEVERFAQDILVIINGKLAAAGDFRTIRDHIDSHDHEIRIVASDARGLAGLLFTQPMVSGVSIDRQGRLLVQTTDVREFLRMVPSAAKHGGIRLLEMQPTDDSLQSVFSYLVKQ
ncbi:MAG: ABC transporter ATP-binding protein [Thermomicrobiales bacterium]|nr:ABC transporter ATP-binding protein [Thermomicrobiales bacterium]